MLAGCVNKQLFGNRSATSTWKVRTGECCVHGLFLLPPSGQEICYCRFLLQVQPKGKQFNRKTNVDGLSIEITKTIFSKTERRMWLMISAQSQFHFRPLNLNQTGYGFCMVQSPSASFLFLTWHSIRWPIPSFNPTILLSIPLNNTQPTPKTETLITGRWVCESMSVQMRKTSRSGKILTFSPGIW